jgi:hypothetical protein
MSGILHERAPWRGLASITIAGSLLVVIRFLTAPEGQSWLEDFARPWGYAAILLGVAGPLLFLGTAALVGILAIASGARHEPLYLGELAVAIVVSLYFQIGSSRVDLWGRFPLRLLLASAVVFPASLAVRWLWRRIQQHSRT